MKRFIRTKDLVIEYQNWFMEPGFERFGQYMYNKYFFDSDPWPELFYEEDPDKAFSLIANNCLEV